MPVLFQNLSNKIEKKITAISAELPKFSLSYVNTMVLASVLTLTNYVKKCCSFL